VERIEPIGIDRTVQPVTLSRLTPIERDEERRRREHERERRRKAPRREPPAQPGGTGIDVRV
jgi:hypothetical protein